MSSRRTIRIGVIGAGSVFQRFRRGVENSSSAIDITALADIVPPSDDTSHSSLYSYYQLPREWAEEPDPRSIPRELNGFYDEVDAVYVACPNHAHAGQILSALHRKKHVLCTKPLTSNYRAAINLVTRIAALPDRVSCARNEPGALKLMYEDHYLYYPLFAGLLDGTIKNPFNQNELGSLEKVEMHFIESTSESRTEPQRAKWLLDPKRSGGGVWIDNGVHLQQMLNKLGAEISITSATATFEKAYQAETGMSCSATLNRVVGKQPSLIEWNNTPAMLVVQKNADQPSKKELVFFFQKAQVKVDFKQGRIFKVHRDSGESETLHKLPQPHPDPFENLARVFAELVQGKVDARLADLDDGIKQMKLIKEVYARAGLTDQNEKWRD
ncbi:MAG: Gfo/Idh/MocA family oxidoreductase [Proteobacteria bacterium]|nr:Gfo/Idh/MocA family oxidoreductase [Pseudomonadota bacterium]